MNDQFQMILETLRRYNAGELDLSDDKANQLASIAFQMKQQFKTRSKPIRKGLFDLIDTAALGMIPNKWRPESPGQDLYGESGVDKFAGGVGTLGGIATGIGGAYKLATKAPWIANTTGNIVGKGVSKAGQYGRTGMDKIKSTAGLIKEREAIKRAQEIASKYYNSNPYNIDFTGVASGI